MTSFDNFRRHYLEQQKYVNNELWHTIHVLPVAILTTKSDSLTLRKEKRRNLSKFSNCTQISLYRAHLMHTYVETVMIGCRNYTNM